MVLSLCSGQSSQTIKKYNSGTFLILSLCSVMSDWRQHHHYMLKYITTTKKTHFVRLGKVLNNMPNFLIKIKSWKLKLLFLNKYSGTFWYMSILQIIMPLLEHILCTYCHVHTILSQTSQTKHTKPVWFCRNMLYDLMLIGFMCVYILVHTVPRICITDLFKHLWMKYFCMSS